MFEKYASNEGIPLPTKHLFNKAARLSLYDLIRYTPMAVRERRKDGCRTFFYGTQYFKRTGKRGLRVFAYRTGCNKHTYTTQIGFVDWRKGLKSSIWVHCTCDHFKFNLEYVLAQLGASELVFSWNQPPHVRNPEYVPYACKHIIGVVDDALNRAKQFGKKDLETELQDVNVDEIELTPFEKKQLEDKNRFKKLQEPKKSEQFKPYTKSLSEKEKIEPATKPVGNKPDSNPEPSDPPPSPFGAIPRMRQ